MRQIMELSIKQVQLIVITFRLFLLANYIMKLKIEYYLIIFPMNLKKASAMRLSVLQELGKQL